MFYEASYEPSEKDQPDAKTKKYVGKKLALQDGWKLEEGPYKGKYCYLPSDYSGCIPGPSLKNIKNISYTRWKDLQAGSADT